MTTFPLKIIAMVTMAVDHIGFALCDNNTQMRAIGRMAFPIYAFLMAEAYYHLREKRDRYRTHLVKLIILAFASETPHDLCINHTFFSLEQQNAIFTLLFGLITLFLVELWYKEYGRYKIFAYAGRGMVVLAAALLAAVLRFTYDYSGIFLITLFYLYLKHADRWPYPKRCLTLSAICVIFYGMQLVPDIFTEDIYLLWESEKYWLLGLIPVVPLLADITESKDTVPGGSTACIVPFIRCISC